MSAVALVTGAAHGIGAAIARRLAADGFIVAATAEMPLPPEQRSISELAIVADFSDPAKAAEVVDEVAATFGRLDVLVNNAGITKAEVITDVDPHDLDLLLAVNLRAPWYAIRAAVPHLRAHRGCVVNVTSLHADAGMRGFSVYASTKGGLSALTRQLAIELAPDGIRVNAVQPGLVDAARLHEDAWYAKGAAGERVPLGRVGVPEDVAGAVSFLVGADAAYVTGIVLPVDGGVGARMAFEWGDE